MLYIKETLDNSIIINKEMHEELLKQLQINGFQVEKIKTTSSFSLYYMIGNKFGVWFKLRFSDHEPYGKLRDQYDADDFSIATSDNFGKSYSREEIKKQINNVINKAKNITKEEREKQLNDEKESQEKKWKEISYDITDYTHKHKEDELNIQKEREDFNKKFKDKINEELKSLKKKRYHEFDGIEEGNFVEVSIPGKRNMRYKFSRKNEDIILFNSKYGQPPIEFWRDGKILRVSKN
jgi:hypothetical protein